MGDLIANIDSNILIYIQKLKILRCLNSYFPIVLCLCET